MKNESKKTKQVKYDLPVKGSAEPITQPERTHYKINEELIRRKCSGS